MNFKIKYLPLRNFHIVPISDLQPESLKKAAKLCKKDREKISHNTILNASAKALGFSQGFAGYCKSYEKELLPFMKKHNLVNMADLLTHRNVHLHDFKELSEQQLAERIFYSNRPIPEKVFTGFDFNFKDSIDDGFLVYETDLKKKGQHAEFSLPYPLAPKSEKQLDDILSKAENESEQFVEFVTSRFTQRRTVEDLVIGRLVPDCRSFNLIGDVFVHPRLQGNVFCANGLNNFSQNELDEELYSSKIADAFRRRVDKCVEGWVDVLPFNENLVFLKGRNGEYNFIFKGLSGREFDHVIYGGALKLADTPSFFDLYSYERWLYFEYKGWAEYDINEAERSFCLSSGQTYPGQYEVIKRYLMPRNFSQKQRAVPFSLIDGFYRGTGECQHLAISNAISIAQFREFLQACPRYMEYRQGQDWETVNAEIDESLPATVNWYDVLAYTRWFEEQNNLSVRLLKHREFVKLRTSFPSVANETIRWEDLMPIWNEDTKKIIYLFKSNIPVIAIPSGIQFLESNSYAEWLLEETCIRSQTLTSFRDCDNLFEDKPPLYCTGQYKEVKIGFRLCYELSQ